MKQIVMLSGLLLVLAACLPQTTPQGEAPEVTRTVVEEETVNSEREQVGEAENGQEQEDSRYAEYTPEAMARAQAEGKTVLFFKADWCPTCRAADRDIRDKLDQIPNDVTILQVDFDNERELKQEYGVVGQHTFVVIDSDGNEVNKWIGGGLSEILNQV